MYRNADDETEPDEELKSPAELDRFLQSLPRTRPEVTAAEAYSTMRRGMAEAEDARVLLGGRVADSADGRPPGVAEEALLAIRAGNLVLPFPAWGGCAHDVADALGILPERFVTRTPSTGYQAQLDEVRNRSERYLRSLDGKGLSAAVRIALAEADTPSRVAQATLLALAERPDRSE